MDPDPDPHQNVLDPEHWYKESISAWMWGASFLVIEERVVDIQDQQLLPLAAGVQHLHLIVSYLEKQVWLIDSWLSQYLGQRGLNDLWRTKLSYGRMIRLHNRPLLPPLQPTNFFVPLSQFSCVSPVQLTDGRGVGVEPNHTTARKLGPL